ncbi:VTC domain-containing protein [Homoserinimonas aerilata]|uniref:VTC domain-containing protein n=1 Tax=Homoserinimonas aerilata TaxID=1162970 RepID=A0A542YGT4_9MICO|nr:polyphosphate polymerase domain-containing protein [Homoserinimonas aerilata]TQL47184.1 VTC domain-containing protein [Homoserinimonas aerilata]
MSATTSAPGAPVLAAHAPIGLDELLEEASLQIRVDRKYLLLRHELDSVLADLDPAIRVLEIDGRRAFGYESVYFDTPALDSYLSAAQPRRRRFKIRTRGYLDSGEAWLEVKTRGGRDMTVKDRAEHDFGHRDRLDPAGHEHIGCVLAAAGIRGIESQLLRPVLMTAYDRTTLFVPDSLSRATIDTGLGWHDGPRSLLLPASVIVETKSGSAPSGVDRMLWAHGHRPLGISKFGTGLAALRPNLPSNRWSRVIREHFASDFTMTRTEP